MKTFLLINIILLTLLGQAFAYVTDRVLVAGTTTDQGQEAALLMKEATVTIEDVLTEAYPCLKVATQNQLKQGLDDLRQLTLLGPGGWQWFNNANANDPDSTHQDTSYDEEEAFRKKMDEKMAELADVAGAKYLVHVTIQKAGKTGYGISTIAINMKKEQIYYRDYQVFNSSAAAITGAKGVAEKLVKGFSQYLSGQKTGIGEVCPFTGRVDVYREKKRERTEKTHQYYYCNGSDQEGTETDKFTSLSREVWSLERFGNPDTRGGLEAQSDEETFREEVNNCYVCGPDEIGRRVWTSVKTVTGTVNGLSDKSKGESVNKDATVKLHFNEDNTYTVTVHAASIAGVTKKTSSETAVGICNPIDNRPPDKTGTYTLGLEYTFGPFPGTPFDDKLSGQKEIKLLNEDIKEETILRIDFELNGFKGK